MQCSSAALRPYGQRVSAVLREKLRVPETANSTVSLPDVLLYLLLTVTCRWITRRPERA